MRRRMRYRPSRANCIFGGIVGIIFTCIGLFVAIPTAGAFGVLWTLIALAMTVYQFAMAAGKVSAGSWSIEEEDEGRDGAPGGKSAQDRLTELRSLYDRGLISPNRTERSVQLKDILLIFHHSNPIYIYSDRIKLTYIPYHKSVSYPPNASA